MILKKEHLIFSREIGKLMKQLPKLLNRCRLVFQGADDLGERGRTQTGFFKKNKII